jgi:hypothetical protein
MSYMTNSLNTLEAIKQSRETAIKAFTPNVAEVFSQIDPAILDQNEMELERSFNRTPNDYALRKRLWELVATGRSLTISEWAKGVCDDQYINRRIFKNPYRLTWLFTPLSTHQEMFDEAFHLMFNKMRDYLSKTTITDENIAQHAALFEKIANRAIGPVAKNINLKTQAIPAPQAPMQMKTVEDIDKRIAELENMKPTAPIIDVEPG